MHVTGLRTALFAAVMAAGLGAVVLAQRQPSTSSGQGGQGQAGQPPQGRGPARPQNLQVLPKDWTLQQVQQQMRTFTAALNVECSHCHVGTMAERSKDDNPMKAIARKMLQMTMSINKDLLKDVGEAPAEDTPAKVTCYTCHRGAIKPLNAPGGGGN